MSNCTNEGNSPLVNYMIDLLLSLSPVPSYFFFITKWNAIIMLIEKEWIPVSSRVFDLVWNIMCCVRNRWHDLLQNSLRIPFICVMNRLIWQKRTTWQMAGLDLSLHFNIVIPYWFLFCGLHLVFLWELYGIWFCFLFITFLWRGVIFELCFFSTFLPVQPRHWKSLFILFQLLVTHLCNQTGTVYWTRRCQVTQSLSHTNVPPRCPPCLSPCWPNGISLPRPDEKSYDHLNKHRQSMVSLSVRPWRKVSSMFYVCVSVRPQMFVFLYRHNCCWIHTPMTKRWEWTCTWLSVATLGYNKCRHAHCFAAGRSTVLSCPRCQRQVWPVITRHSAK